MASKVRSLVETDAHRRSRVAISVLSHFCGMDLDACLLYSFPAGELSCALGVGTLHPFFKSLILGGFSSLGGLFQMASSCFSGKDGSWARLYLLWWPLPLFLNTAQTILDDPSLTGSWMVHRVPHGGGECSLHMCQEAPQYLLGQLMLA